MKNAKSLKGKWGNVGAPPKAIKLPTVAFTVARAIALNPNVCELTVRKYVAKCLKAGVLKKGEPIPQPKGGVGRPKFRFEPTGKALPVKLAKVPKAPKATKTVKAKTTKAPASTPVVSVTTSAPVPVETTPVAATTPVETVSVTAVETAPVAAVEPAPLP